MKKFAYIFLLVCVIVVAYFAYDTYRIVSADEEDLDSVIEEEVMKASDTNTYVSIRNSDFDLDEIAVASVLDGNKLYLYDAEPDCEANDLYESSNNKLLAILSLDQGDSPSSVVSSQFVKHQVTGESFVVSSVPKVKNSIEFDNADPNDEGKYKGSVELEWDGRSISGKFETSICNLNQDETAS